MPYTVQQITALTDTHISVLLSDDVAYDVDRGAFEEYVTEGTGMYEFAEPMLMGSDIITRTKKMTLSEYWEDRLVNDQMHITDLENYIAQSKSEQLEIDVVRAWSDCYQTIDANMNLTDGLVMQTFVKAYGTAIKNQITYQNQ